MIKQFSKLILLAVLTFGVSLNMIAQTGYEIDFSQTEGFNITGTSTLHGWTVQVNKIGGEPGVLDTDFSTGSTIDDFYFFAEVATMDGGRGSSMNTKIKNALKAEEHPKIKFKQTSPATVKAGSGDTDFRILSKGELTIAGNTKDVELLLSGKKMDGNKITLSGNVPLKFSEYSIEPPSAMFGQIVCGDDVEVNINLILKGKNQN